MGLEYLAEGAGGAVGNIQGHIGYGSVGSQEPEPGFFHLLSDNVLPGCFSHEGLKHTYKMKGRKAGHIRQGVQAQLLVQVPVDMEHDPPDAPAVIDDGLPGNCLHTCNCPRSITGSGAFWGRHIPCRKLDILFPGIPVQADVNGIAALVTVHLQVYSGFTRPGIHHGSSPIYRCVYGGNGFVVIGCGGGGCHTPGNCREKQEQGKP